MINKIENETNNSRGVSSKHQPFRPRFLILDDDQIVATVMHRHLGTCFPNAIIEISTEALALPNYDIYFIDNDFGGKQLAFTLLNQIREISPFALVVAMSNTLDLRVMKELVNGGCNAVYDKRFPEQSNAAREVIQNYISIVEEKSSRSNQNTLIEVIRSIKTLLWQWNKRLEKSI